MANKEKRTVLSFPEGEIDPVTKDAFYEMCRQWGLRPGELLNEFMKQSFYDHHDEHSASLLMEQAKNRVARKQAKFGNHNN